MANDVHCNHGEKSQDTDDGSIDLLDFPIWESDYNNFNCGYFASDLNGDGCIDLVDFPIWESNYNIFISVIKP